jgi:hypothetical protein
MSLANRERLVSHRIEALQRVHIEQVVDIHLQAFPNFFISFLGPRFLRKFYGSFLVDPLGVGFLACSPSGDVMGAVVGPLNPQGYFKQILRRRWWAFCMASVGAVARHPSCLSINSPILRRQYAVG